MTRARIALLVAFDRSGSSMVAKMLARHPRVNLLFQPFNGTEVHRAQWEVWTPERRAPATETFLQGLLEGRLDASYIASDWFEKHSTSLDVDPARLNLVKDTKLHLKVDWLARRFPEIELFGLWRDPRAIVASLVRNGFHESWYGESAFREAARLVEERDELAKLRPFRETCTSAVRRAAIVVAVRNDHLFRRFDRSRRLDYETVLADPDGCLNRFGARLGLGPFRYAPALREDHNVAGRPFERADLWRDVLPASDRDFLDALTPLVGAPEGAAPATCRVAAGKAR